MKTKYIILAAVLICSTATFAQNNQRAKFSNELNQGMSNQAQMAPGTPEQELRDNLVPILKQAGLNAKYYDQDGEKSVDFTYNGTNYWYTAERGQGTILLTLTRSGKKMHSSDNQVMYNEDAVLQAINAINNKYFSMKMYYDTKKQSIKICQQTILKNANYLTPDAVKNSLNEMESAWKEYDRVYNEFSEGKPVISNPEGKKAVFPVPHMSKVSIQSIEIESVDGNGNRIAAVENGGINNRNVQFIRPILVLSSPEPKNYTIDIKIINEDGNMMKYEDASGYTISGQVEVKKKPQETVVGMFGSPDYKNWAKGLYTVEVYESDALLQTTTFTIN